MKEILSLGKFWRPSAVLIGGLLLGSGFVNILAYVWPWAAKIYLDRFIQGQELAISGMLVAVLSSAIGIKFILQTAIKTTTFRLAQEAAMRIRQEMHIHLQNLSMSRIKSLEQSNVLAKAFLDVENIRRFLSSEALESLMACLNIIFLTVILFCLNGSLAISVIVIVPACVGIHMCVLPRLKKGFDAIQSNNEGLMHQMGEFIQAAGLIRAMALEQYLQDRFSKAQKESLQVSQENYRTCLGLLNTMEILSGLNAAVIFVFGIFLVGQGCLTVGELVAFYLFWSMLSGPILRLGSVQGSFQELISSSARINDFFALKNFAPSISGDAVNVDHLFGSITLKNVSFGYEGQPNILENISWHIEPGQMVALVGESGAGKTTLLQLMLRFYDPGRGDIFIDGHPLKTLDLESFRKHVGVVLQDDFIFSGTIHQNLILGREDITETQVKCALEAACALDFVEHLPGGIFAQVGERGLRLSVGQRQRLAIARALLRKPKILLLDEATCALDALTENRVQKNIREFCPESTVVIIAHRFSTIMDVDHIAVLDRGFINQQGTHTYLLSQDGLYSRLYYEQFK